MAPKPEETARAEIDRLLTAAGWEVAAAADVNIRAHRGVAIREFPLKDGYGFADYMLYVDGKAVGVLEAKKSGVTLSGVEPQSERYVRGLPEGLPAWLVMEYSHEMAVADKVNVNYDVYRTRTQVSEGGGQVEAGYYVDLHDKLTRKVRWEQLDEEFAYDPGQLDRDVVAVDQIRTLVRTFRDRLFTEIFPGRTEVPKTLVFAKDDSHAEEIVRIVREEFAKGNEFAQKITYRTTGAKPDDLIASFRNSYHPRIAVTVDMIATGTDINPLEIVVFMRAVKSRTFFEQMKGQGVRVISPDDLKGVTPDAKAKDHFVVVDCVGVCERDLTDSRPMDQKKSVPLEGSEWLARVIGGKQEWQRNVALASMRSNRTTFNLATAH